MTVQHALAALLLCACAAVDGPRLASVTPAQAAAGATVELSGSRFCLDHVDCATAAADIELGLSPPILQATILTYSEMSAMIRIPSVAEPGTTHIVLVVDGRSSNALAFEVLP